ncbi:beta-lactamase family protein [Flavobacterium sp. MR2016-29]|uniref:serine hydrolase domain-containing protein n=1 Tax=Flavobacterium sp. MR2016-29 TaxID=2783795 RepID=UPI00188A0D83|nr:serine hydrolase domain-containing protein [Flavobacterium sp. MR2016-29]MBF4491616.1 beta-lactamase family protein [Flavobacterium sp. MR2016-29]
MKKIITCLFTLVITSAFAQTFNAKRMDSLFLLLEKNNKYMGSIAISENGKTIYSRSIGFDDIATSKKSSINTKYRIGSISKTFTASLIFKAVEENKINLNQTIDKYFPTIKNAKTITISNLLNHRSGIHDFTNDPDYLKWNTQPQSRAKMTEKIAAGEIVFEPDTKSQYSNSNYVLLSFILEDVYKKSYAEILNQKIIKPLKLKNTYLGGKISIENNESYSYTLAGKWEKESETDMSIPLGAGAIVSNPTDLNFFIESLFAGKVVSMEHLNEMKTIKGKYGMGILEFPYFERKSYGHNGSIDGFRAILGYFPEDKLALSITSNGMGYDNNNILLCALSSYFRKPFSMPTFSNVAVTPETLDLYSGTYGSSQIPLKISISKKDNTLIAQATGQPSFPLEATAVNIFKFDAAGVVLEFNAGKKEMILKQGGKEFLFSKE